MKKGTPGKGLDRYLPAGRIRDEMTHAFEKLIDGDLEAAGSYENPVLTKQGEERIIAWHNTVIRDEAGNITGSLSSGEDITDRRRAEEALRKAHDELECVLRSAPENCSRPMAS